MTTQTTNTETQIQIALEVLKMDETEKTKATIAKEYGISSRSVSRYAGKYEEEAMDLLASDVEPETQKLNEAFEGEKAEAEAEVEEQAGEPDESNVEEEVTSTETEETTRKRAPITREDNGLTKNQNNILATYYKQKGTMDKTDERQGKTGRAKKGVKTIRYITMEILEAHANAGTLTKTNKDDIIDEIAKTGNVEQKTAKQYFSGHKILFGGFQD